MRRNEWVSSRQEFKSSLVLGMTLSMWSKWFGRQRVQSQALSCSQKKAASFEWVWHFNKGVLFFYSCLYSFIRVKSLSDFSFWGHSQRSQWTSVWSKGNFFTAHLKHSTWWQDSSTAKVWFETYISQKQREHSWPDLVLVSCGYI